MNMTRIATRQVVDSLGTTAPKAITDAISTAERIAAAAGSLGEPVGERTEAIYNAIEARLDPAADPEVARLVVLSLISDGARTAVQDHAYECLAVVCRQHLDQIIEAWRKQFDTAIATLTHAHERITVPLEDAEEILRQGADVATTWAAARDAVASIERIAAGWSALGEMTHLAPRDNRWQSLRICDPSFAQVEALGLEHKRIGPWAAVMAGVPLSLPGYPEYHARVAAILAARVQAEAQAEQARKTGRRVPA